MKSGAYHEVTVQATDDGRGYELVARQREAPELQRVDIGMIPAVVVSPRRNLPFNVPEHCSWVAHYTAAPDMLHTCAVELTDQTVVNVLSIGHKVMNGVMRFMDALMGPVAGPAGIPSGGLFVILPPSGDNANVRGFPAFLKPLPQGGDIVYFLLCQPML